MNGDDSKRYTLADLVAETGVAARTIRYYISRGLLEGPLVAGRNARYTSQHLDRLKAIQARQSEGAMLNEIARELEDGGKETQHLPPPAEWHGYTIGDDVMVWVRADRAPWRGKQLQTAVREFAARVRGTPESRKESG